MHPFGIVMSMLGSAALMPQACLRLSAFQSARALLPRLDAASEAKAVEELVRNRAAALASNDRARSLRAAYEARVAAERGTFKLLKQVFDEYDVDNSAKLDTEELRRMCKVILGGGALTDEKLLALIAVGDPSGLGQLDFGAFVATIGAEIALGLGGGLALVEKRARAVLEDKVSAEKAAEIEAAAEDARAAQQAAADKMAAGKQAAAERAAAEKQAAAEKTAADKAAALKAVAEKAAELKTAADRAAAERAAVLKAAAEQAAALKAAAEKAAAERAEMGKAAVEERAKAKRAAVERAAAEEAAAEKAAAAEAKRKAEDAEAAAERAAAEKAAAQRAKAERARAEKMAVEKTAAEKAKAEALERRVTAKAAAAAAKVEAAERRAAEMAASKAALAAAKAEAAERRATERVAAAKARAERALVRASTTTKPQVAIVMLSALLTHAGVALALAAAPGVAMASARLGRLGLLITATPQLAQMLLGLPVGLLVDAIGRKPALVLGGALEAVGAASAAGVGISASVRALGGSVGSIAMQAYTLDLAGNVPSRSALLLGLLQAGSFLAYLISPALVRWMLAGSGPVAPVPLSMALLIWASALRLTLPETHLPAQGGASAYADEGGRGAASGDSDDVKTAADAMGPLASYRALASDGLQLALLALHVSFVCSLSLVPTVVPLQAAVAGIFDLDRLYNFVTLLSVCVSPLAGALADRHGRVHIAMGGSLAIALGAACMPFATSAASFYALRAVWAVGEALLITAYMALTLDVTPREQRGARTALDLVVGALAFACLPMAMAALACALSPAAAFWAAATAVLLTSLVVYARLVSAPPSST